MFTSSRTCMHTHLHIHTHAGPKQLLNEVQNRSIGHSFNKVSHRKQRNKKSWKSKGQCCLFVSQITFRNMSYPRTRKCRTTISSCKREGTIFYIFVPFTPPRSLSESCLPNWALSGLITAWLVQIHRVSHCFNPNRRDVLAGQGHPNPRTLVQSRPY